MKKMKTVATVVGLVFASSVALALALRPEAEGRVHAQGFARKVRPHFDHAAVIPDAFESPQAVTRACLKCHPGSAEVMNTPHFQWLGDEVEVPGHPGRQRLGKRNLINNFCIASTGNEKACTKCHAGYGWTDATYDFKNPENVDCLVCHERTNAYVKGPYGLPQKGTDLVAAARSVATPARENCLGCHAYGGGGQAVKHGDIDSSLAHPFEEEDVHIGGHQFLCVDCHSAPNHRIRGRAFSVSVEDSHGVACTECHTRPEHRDERINAHLGAVACQSCHIPTYAGKLPTKAYWDWSKAGDAGRQEDLHSYLRIKGEFSYAQDAVPEYRWFNGTVDRYLVGDAIDPAEVTVLNPPRGGVADKSARIWPFKVHRGKQPYDTVNRTFLTPTTGGPGGYWTTFDWKSALELGARAYGQPFSGQYGFAATEMWWPLSHMVAPKERALGCTDCHGAKGRMDWKALGYPGDPIEIGGRR